MSALKTEHTIASYAVDLAVALGAELAFTLTGGMAMFINRAVAVHPELQAVYCQHEQACVAAAEGYSKSKKFRAPGFAVVTAGPGVSNTITSLISAYGDSVPMIVLAGQIKTNDIDSYGTRTHGIQEIKSREIITPCVKRFVRLEADNFRPVLIKTLVEMFSERPGPVFIEIPLDVQGVSIPDTAKDVADAAAEITRRVAEGSSTPAHRQALVDCLRDLLRAKRPLIYVGNGCRVAGVEEAIGAFIARHQLPAVFSWLSFDIISARDDLHFGCPGGLAPIYANEILGAADTILFLGARLDLGTTAFQRDAFGHQAERYFVDIDPAELSKFDKFPEAHCIEANLKALPAAIASFIGSNSAALPDWLPWCRDRRKTYLEEENSRLASTNMNVHGITDLLSAWSDNKVFVSASSGYAEETFTRFFVPGPDARFFNGAALGAMGMGLANALGAAFGTSQQVVCLEADGGIMLNIQELATLSHYAPKGFVLIVFNNGGYESIRSSQSRFFKDVNGADADSGLYIPDFADLANAFKLRYVRIENLKDFSAQLSTFTADAPPIMVDLIIDKFEYRGPAVKTVIDANGRPSSTPLREITW